MSDDIINNFIHFSDDHIPNKNISKKHRLYDYMAIIAGGGMKIGNQYVIISPQIEVLYDRVDNMVRYYGNFICKIYRLSIGKTITFEQKLISWGNKIGCNIIENDKINNKTKEYLCCLPSMEMIDLIVFVNAKLLEKFNIDNGKKHYLKLSDDFDD